MELTSSSVDRKASQAHEAVEAAAAKASARIAPAIDRIARAAHRTVDGAAQAAGPAANWLNENAAQLRERRQQILDNTRGYVRHRPLLATGIALAIGYLAARLVR